MYKSILKIFKIRNYNIKNIISIYTYVSNMWLIFLGKYAPQYPQLDINHL